MMDAFKKWKADNKFQLISISEDLDKINACNVSAEIAWRAALKETLKQAGELMDPYEIIAWIEKELEG